MHTTHTATLADEKEKSASMAIHIPSNDERQMQRRTIQSDDKTHNRVRLEKGNVGPTLGVIQTESQKAAKNVVQSIRFIFLRPCGANKDRKNDDRKKYNMQHAQELDTWEINIKSSQSENTKYS